MSLDRSHRFRRDLVQPSRLAQQKSRSHDGAPPINPSTSDIRNPDFIFKNNNCLQVGALWAGRAVFAISLVLAVGTPQALAQIDEMPPTIGSSAAATLAQQGNTGYLLFVNPSLGNDSNDGRQGSPLRTLTHALQIAQPNTVIILSPGTYSADTGEQFPLNLSEGVTVQGDPSTQGQGIVIRGGGEFLSPSAARQNVTMLGSDRASLTGVTITNPNPRGYGLWLESTSPQVERNTFSNSAHDGISIVGTSAPLIQNNRFSRNSASGISVFGQARPNIRNNSFEQTGFGINIGDYAQPLIEGNQISNNRSGVVVQEYARPILRDNQIENSMEDGLVAIADAVPDVGTVAASGNNTFRNNRQYDIHAGGNQSIPAFGNQLTADRINGAVDLTGTVVPPPLELPPYALGIRAAETTVSDSNSSATRSTAQAATRSTAQAAPPSNAPAAPPVAMATTTVSPATPPTDAHRATPARDATATTPARRTTESAASFPRPTFTNSGSSRSINVAVQTTQPAPTVAPAPSRPPSAALSSPPAAASTTSATSRSASASSSRHTASHEVTAWRPSAATPVAQSTAGSAQPIEIPVPPPATPAIAPPASPIQPVSYTSPAQAIATASAQPIEIPVSLPVAPQPAAPTYGAAPRSLSPAPQSNALPVPGGDIPLGNTGNMQRVLVSQNPLPGGPPAPPTPTSSLGLRYRVLVEAPTEEVQAGVRALISESFRTYIDGQVMMQAGAYGSRANAESTMQWLNNNGFRAMVRSLD